jgi:hypothetical protein
VKFRVEETFPVFFLQLRFIQQYGTVIFNIDRHLHIRCMVTYPQTDTANAYLINDDFTRVVLGLYIHSACTFTFGFIVDDL